MFPVRSAIRRTIVAASFCCVFSAMTWAATAEPDQQAANRRAPLQHYDYFDIWSVNWENDAVVGTDKDYTNGFKVTVSTPFGHLEESSLPPWSYPVFEHLPVLRTAGGQRALSLAIGQEIYNPDDTDRSELIKDDRPYAGFTYLSAGFHARRAERKDSWLFILGLIGPASKAEDIQNMTHDLLGVDRTMGWDHQLGNEVTVDAAFESQWRLWSYAPAHALGVALIPHAGVRLGTVRTYLNAGTELQLGWNLANNFASCPSAGQGCEIDSTSTLSAPQTNRFHFFITVDGKAVARDIFLDGNTFRNSHSVDKKNFVAEFTGGFSWQIGRARVTYAYVYRSKEFTTQKDNPRYGSLTVSWAFR